jgi:hypothetical protein
VRRRALDDVEGGNSVTQKGGFTATTGQKVKIRRLERRDVRLRIRVEANAANPHVHVGSSDVHLRKSDHNSPFM